MDIVCSDFLWSVFTCAVGSYKHDSLTKPFPQEYVSEDGQKNFRALKSSVSRIPCFTEIDWNRMKKNDPEALRLLKTVIEPAKFNLKLKGRNHFAIVQHLVEDESNCCPPDYIIQVNYNAENCSRFDQRQGTHKLLYGYHGTRLENFYSILHHGLKNSLNKVSLFGEGIYLSSDYRVSLNYSPSSKNWEDSLLGDRLSCVAVCEIVDHPEYVKCSKKQASRSESTTANVTSRSNIQGSEGGEIPEKYYIVRNDEMIRLKYVLVYAPNADKSLIHELLTTSGRGHHRASRKTQQQSTVSAFLSRHKFLLSMAAYVVFLLFISFINSSWFKKWRRES